MYYLMTVGNAIALIVAGMIVGMFWMGVFFLAEITRIKREFNRFIQDNKLTTRWLDFKNKEKLLK